PHEALRNEVQLSVLLTALCGFHLKQCQDPVDTMAPCAMRTQHCTLAVHMVHRGLGGCGLEGAAGAEPGDEPHPYPGLDAGQGQVQPRSDCWQVTPWQVTPDAARMAPRAALDLSRGSCPRRAGKGIFQVDIPEHLIPFGQEACPDWALKWKVTERPAH
ncbi:hypothetical protein Celaphus_00009680, partial [Cervus elaphus hippelaphus]